ncbi:hypothetical protein BsWGS_25384 [Bradybaena similaris]
MDISLAKQVEMEREGNPVLKNAVLKSDVLGQKAQMLQLNGSCPLNAIFRATSEVIGMYKKKKKCFLYIPFGQCCWPPVIFLAIGTFSGFPMLSEHVDDIA